MSNDVEHRPVVLTDVVKYSLRSPRGQRELIAKLSGSIEEASVSHGVESTLPTGDGALLILSDDASNPVTMALDLAIDLHSRFAAPVVDGAVCEVFAQGDGYCECHPDRALLRTAVGYGPHVIYTDINDQLNGASTEINLTARTLGVIPPNALALTPLAHERLLGFEENPPREFQPYQGLVVKHGVSIDTHLYVGSDQLVVSIPEPSVTRVSDELETAGEVCAPDLQLISMDVRRGLPIEDQSELFYLFLSVVDTGVAREVIRRTFEDVSADEDSVRLHAVYDLLGKWDLVVKFSCDQRLAVRPLVRDPLMSALKERNQVSLSGRRGEVQFTDEELVDVRRQARTLDELSDPDAPIEDPAQIRLGTTEEYERYRTQRAFLYIETRRVADLPARLARVLAQADTGSSSVIESVALGDSALVVEIFMRCSQSPMLNQLNRDIQNELSRNNQQKYTMTVYEYHEYDASALQVNERTS